MPNERDITAEFKDNLKYAQEYWSPYVNLARATTKAAAGRSWTTQEMALLAEQHREPLEYNIIRNKIEFLSGYLRDNLKSVVIAPVEGSDQKTADQFTKVEYQIWDKDYGNEVFLNAADECIKSGICLAGVEMNYAKDFLNGDVTFFSRTFGSFYLDPTFENIDLRDCGFAMMRDIIKKDSVRSLMPTLNQKDIDEIGSVAFGTGQYDKYNSYLNYTIRQKDSCVYDRYYVRTTKNHRYMIDETTGYFKDVTGKSDSEIKDLKIGLERMSMIQRNAELYDLPVSEEHKIYFKTVERPYIELNVFINERLVYNGIDQTKITEMYPFAPVICFFEPSIWDSELRIQGQSQVLYLLNRDFNKRHVKIVDIIDRCASKGYKYLLGSIPDVTDLENTGQNVRIGVEGDPEKNPAGLGALEEINGGDVPSSLLEYQDILNKLSLDLANINPSLMGMDEGGNTQISGRLAQTRIIQGLISNRKIFDNIEIAQKILGKVAMLAVQRNYPAGKIRRIINEEPTQQFYLEDFEQYDAVIKEAVRSQSQKDAYYYELVNLKREGIVNISEQDILKALSMTGLSDLEESIAQREQAQAQEEKEVKDIEKTLMIAEAKQRFAMAKESEGRMQNDLAGSVEKLSQAAENKSQAVLDKAKTITEIASMNDDRILKVLEFIKSLNIDQSIDQTKNEIKSEVKKSQLQENIENVNDKQVQPLEVQNG